MFLSINDWKIHKNKLNENANNEIASKYQPTITIAEDNNLTLSLGLITKDHVYYHNPEGDETYMYDRDMNLLHKTGYILDEIFFEDIKDYIWASPDMLYNIKCIEEEEGKQNNENISENKNSFSKLKFNSHTWHNNECDILEGHLDSDSFITYGIYVKDSASGKRKAGDEFMEYYKGSNYVVGSKERPHSRVFGVENIPAKYKAKWNELKAIYEEKYKGKEHVKESSNVEEAYTFDFEEFMDTDLSGPAVEMSINNLIDEFIDIVNNEIDKEGAGTGANLDAVKKQAYRAIAELWKRNIDEYLLKGIKFNA